MGNQTWLDSVRQRLARQALPSTYVKRFTEELSDHLEDIKEHNMEADLNSRLGEPEKVANAAVLAYRRRSFLGRHPILAFGISPFFSLIVVFYIFGTAYLLLIEACGIYDTLHHLGTFGKTLFCQSFLLLTIVVPSILVCVLYCHLARRLGMNRKWFVTACAVVAVMASSASCWPNPGGVFYFDIRWVGFWFGLWICKIQHFMQFIVPLAVAYWFLRHKPDRNQLGLA